MEITPQSQWKGLVEELIKHRGNAILLGATDSGKSTLAKYLIEKLLAKNIKVSLVDSDIGQSTLGLPGTICMKTFTPLEIPVFLTGKDFKYERMSFIGVFNPAERFPLMIKETERMVNLARKHSEITLVDTTGLVSGEVGKALKIGKIKAIKPEHIIAIERYDELEQILALCEDFRIYRIKASHMAKIRGRESRIRYRKEKFRSYFSDSEMAEFILEDVKFFYAGSPFYYKGIYPTFKKGTLIGLNHNEDTKALGILIELINKSIAFKSPINSLKGVNRVVLGDIVIE